MTDIISLDTLEIKDTNRMKELFAIKNGTRE
jgi:hypothetical protein